MARKGQSFQKYTEELKREAVRLRLEERKSLREIREQLGVKSDAQIIEWVKRAQQGESRIILLTFKNREVVFSVPKNI
ncbi:transposase [Bacillus thuringiensis]|uniref:transposase n=1 Tax=Bacillus thuringiensis TaxID=1428 RepID=UPI0012D401A8